MVSILGFVVGAPVARFLLPFCGCVGREGDCGTLFLLGMFLLSCNARVPFNVGTDRLFRYHGAIVTDTTFSCQLHQDSQHLESLPPV